MSSSGTVETVPLQELAVPEVGSDNDDLQRDTMCFTSRWRSPALSSWADREEPYGFLSHRCFEECAIDAVPLAVYASVGPYSAWQACHSASKKPASRLLLLQEVRFCMAKALRKHSPRSAFH